MAIVLRDVLKTYFETNDVPTQAEFIDLIDSLLHNSDKNVANGVASLGGDIKLLPAQLPNIPAELLPNIPDANISAAFLKAVGQLITEINLQGGNVDDFSKSQLYLNAAIAVFGFGYTSGNVNYGMRAEDGIVKLLAANNPFVWSINGQVGIEGSGGKLEFNYQTTFTSYGSNRGIVYAADYSASFIAESLITKRYVDSLLLNLLSDRGNYNASSNVFPSTGGSGTSGAVKKGNLWTISVAGTLGGNAVTVGDLVRALIDAPGQTASNWAISETNFTYVPENVTNKDIDPSFLANSNTKYPTQAAVKAHVANFSPIRKTLTLEHAAFNPADVTTYYFGMSGAEVPSTVAGQRKIKVTQNCIIEAVSILWKATNGVQPGALDYYILVNGSTQTLIKNGSLNNNPDDFTNNALAIALNAGDTFEIKMMTPTWTPNPTAMVQMAIITMKLT